MRVLGIGVRPPPAAEGNPSVTPELLASCLAKYSRSNKGIDHILGGIDWNDPDRAVEAIFKFVDYGHASIGGLTGGIAMAIDGCSMWLAYKLFELCPLGDGQESSTRYIKLEPAGLCSPEELGIPTELAAEWREVMERSILAYQKVYAELDAAAEANPSVVRCPANADEKVKTRLRKNYALDRARYLLPFAMRTNCAIVATARVWAQVIRQLASLPQREAQEAATLLRGELEKFAPRLIRHSHRDEPAVAQALREIAIAEGMIAQRGVPMVSLADEVAVTVEDGLSPFEPAGDAFEHEFSGKKNRYSVVGHSVRRASVRYAWNNIALAELRDLNRHRTGSRFSSLSPVGFYLPGEVPREPLQELLSAVATTITRLGALRGSGLFLYGYLLGTQVPFERATQVDKFIYEVELRTGMGAHFRYAEHLAAAAERFFSLRPHYRPFVTLGTAEPE